VKRTATILCVITLLALLGCATAPAPERTRYLMRSSEGTPAGPVSHARLGFRRVVVAPYLKSLGLVVETGPGQVNSARFHEWAEPLDQGLRRFLVPATAAALGESVGGGAAYAGDWAYRVDLYIDQLHGTAEGDALLAAEWRIVDSAGVEVGRSAFSKRSALSGSGYDALAEAELALVAELATAVADSLRDLPKD